MIKPILISQALHEAKQRLIAYGVPLPSIEAELILAHVLQVTRERIIGYPEQVLSVDEYQTYCQMVERRISKEPHAYIVGYREFYGREFKVNSSTLIPRPDSETLIEAVLARFTDSHQPLRILDLGTGSGCLLLTLLAEYPQAIGVGIDASEGALEVARANAVHLGLAKRVDFLLRCFGEDVDGQFDLVITNPPYIVSSEISSLEPEVKHHEPHLALSGGLDGLDHYRKIIPSLPLMLVHSGWFICEIGLGQEQDVAVIVQKNGLIVDELPRDLSGIIRCVVAKKS